MRTSSHIFRREVFDASVDGCLVADAEDIESVFLCERRSTLISSMSSFSRVMVPLLISVINLLAKAMANSLLSRYCVFRVVVSLFSYSFLFFLFFWMSLMYWS